jgi:predicted ATP-grasp superfamily ATP-dependent carboligase
MREVGERSGPLSWPLDEQEEEFDDARQSGGLKLRLLLLDDGFDRGSIAAARALHADGWTVGIGAPVRGIAGSSRACARWHRFPPAEDGLEAFLGAVNAAVASGGYEIVISGDDFRLLALSQRRDEVAATVPYPDHDVVLRAVDKLELARAAEVAGLATPRTVEATDAAISSVQLPVVVKAALYDRPGRVRPILTSTRAEVTKHAAEIRAYGGRPLLQEAMAGRLMAYSFVADRDSSIITAVQQETLHIWPPTIGVTARAHTVPADPELAEAVARLVRDLGWFGMAELQFLRVPGRPPSLIDWNARPYGSLPLAIAAGANLPAVWARLATGRALAPVASSRLGVTFQWFPGDLRASIAERGVGRGALDALRIALGAAHAIWRADDPWPAIRHYSHSGLSSLLRRLRGTS